MGSNHLHPPKEVAAGLNLISVFPEVLTSCFDLISLFWGSIIRIKLPYLSSHEVVGVVDVRIIAPICNLEPPHFLTHQTEEMYLYIYLSLQICVCLPKTPADHPITIKVTQAFLCNKIKLKWYRSDREIGAGWAEKRETSETSETWNGEFQVGITHS